MKTITKHLAILSGLLTLPSIVQGQQTLCDPNARPVFCTPVYSPVCAYPEGCETSLCSYTAINACAACGQSDVVSYTPGECFYNSFDVQNYLQGESEHHGEELEHSGQEEQTGESNEQPGGETGEHGEETGEDGEGNLEEGGSGTEEEIITPEEEVTEQPTEQETEEEEEETEVEEPTEQEEEEEQPGSGTDEETEESENEEEVTTPTNPGNSSSNCPTTGVLVYVNGKFIQGTYCCGAAASCPNKISPVCGSLNTCVGSLCRETKINFRKEHYFSVSVFSFNDNDVEQPILSCAQKRCDMSGTTQDFLVPRRCYIQIKKIHARTSLQLKFLLKGSENISIWPIKMDNSHLFIACIAWTVWRCFFTHKLKSSTARQDLYISNDSTK